MTWIKICGTTNLEDALTAVEAGADALGFVFAESPRKVMPEVVANIVPHLPPAVEKIGVFVSESSEQICAIAKQTGLTAAQLHRPKFMPRDGVAIIPVLHMSEIEHHTSLSFPHPIRAILLDSGNSDKGGGTGRRFDWEAARQFLAKANLSDDFKIIIAGGLDPDNVGEAIELFHPFGVDVVSGVEQKRGKKEPDKVRAFIAAVRAADARMVV